jgi:cephalosporin hydroxylase
MQDIRALLTDPAARARVDEEWEKINSDFAIAYAAMPVKHMARTELSFHSYIKLLAYLSIDVASMDGDVVEIGVWKGKSLAFMQKFSTAPTRFIGIDPFELPGQAQEVDYFRQALFPRCLLIKSYSQNAIESVLQASQRFKLLHIDGGHASENVWADFLLYERFVVPGGYIVFDDYGDFAYSPEVGPAVDRIRNMGLFANYEILGQLPEYEGSYIVRKKHAG